MKQVKTRGNSLLDLKGEEKEEKGRVNSNVEWGGTRQGSGALNYHLESIAGFNGSLFLSRSEWLEGGCRRRKASRRQGSVK